MLRFFDVDEQYAKFLQSIDHRIPNIVYTKNNKFICGIVLKINEIEYYAPISSNIEIQRTNLPIYNKENKVIATIRFCFMFPALSVVLKAKDFAIVSQEDSLYADLLGLEYRYCQSIEDKILEKAKTVYKIGLNKNHFLNSNCCDFKKLEENYMRYLEIQQAQQEAAPISENP